MSLTRSKSQSKLKPTPRVIWAGLGLYVSFNEVGFRLKAWTTQPNLNLINFDHSLPNQTQSALGPFFQLNQPLSNAR